MSDLRRFFRDNPQALVLLIITVVLGIGTFVAVLIAIAGSGSDTTDGEPSDVLLLLHAAVTHVQILTTFA